MIPEINKSQLNQFCSITLLGNLVAKPEIRYTTNPILAVTTLTIATHSKWLDPQTKKYKEWTSYHSVKVTGALVEETLLTVQKGDLILIHGHLLDNNALSQKSKPIEVINAIFIQTFAKGYTQSINQIYCSATINSPVHLMTTEKNKEFAQVNITIKYQEFSPIKQSKQSYNVARSLHCWGKQALELKEQAIMGNAIVIEGKLSYSNNREKSQYIEGKKVHFFHNSANNMI